MKGKLGSQFPEFDCILALAAPEKKPQPSRWAWLRSTG